MTFLSWRRRPRPVVRLILSAAVAVPAMLFVMLWAKPPELIRIAAGYTAKIVCSNVFLAKRAPSDILETDVQSPGVALLKLMRVKVDREGGIVRAGLLGFIGNGLAVVRPDTGCAVVPDGNLAWARGNSRPASASVAEASVAESSAALPDPEAGERLPAVQRIIADDNLAGGGMRAIVVKLGGHIVAERYGPGFDRTTPLLGWSMTKSVTAGLIGILVKDGRLTLDQSAGWTGDDRARITIADLLAMSSGLQFNEGYGAISDVTRMLYLEPNMASFARSKPLVHPVGQTWSYSSGTAVILARIAQDALGPTAIQFISKRLFEPLGMSSAVMETDESGTLVGSSYMYATARDWARYGQLLAQDGMWLGQEVLPRGFVAMMALPVAASHGEYGHGMVWIWATHGDRPGENPDTAFGLPADTFWMAGHDGQYVGVVPSRRLVVARMGLTPAHEHYRPEPLLGAILKVIP